jgi:hypothetical protein
MDDKPFDKEKIELALSLMGDLLARRNAAPVYLIVCGGTALIALDLVSRTTKDMDVVGLLDADHHLLEATQLPRHVSEAAIQIAVELHLPKDWLNSGPKSIINPHLPNNGLPEGFINRLQRRSYGERLEVHYISRLDQIHFKLYAAVDRGGPSYHLDDLESLNPSGSELLAASRWAMLQDPTPAFAQTLKTMLEATGHADVIKKI